MLLNKLIRDEKIINRSLYSSGPYWDYKNSRTILEIKKKGLGDFRGSSAGIGTSFADNIPSDIRKKMRLKRDIKDRARTNNSINSQYKKTVDPMLKDEIKNNKINNFMGLCKNDKVEELDNNKQDEELRILESVCVQHEIDHLNGITCIDREYKREPLKVGPKIGRNEPCPCGSGKKYKKCHIGK